MRCDAGGGGAAEEEEFSKKRKEEQKTRGRKNDDQPLRGNMLDIAFINIAVPTLPTFFPLAGWFSYSTWVGACFGVVWVQILDGLSSGPCALLLDGPPPAIRLRPADQI